MRTSFYRNWVPAILVFGVICTAIGFFTPKQSQAGDASDRAHASDARDATRDARRMMVEASAARAEAREQKAEDDSKIRGCDRVVSEVAQCKAERDQLKAKLASMNATRSAVPSNATCTEKTETEDCEIASQRRKCIVQVRVCVTPKSL